MATIQSDANRSVVRLIEEPSTAFGAVVTTPAFKTLRIKSHGLVYKPLTKITAELASDRNVTDLVRVGVETSGPINMEVAYQSVDDLVRQSMQANWVFTPERDNYGTAGGTISAVSSTLYTFATAPTPTTDQNVGTFLAAMLVYATGFAVAGNNGLKVLTAASATTATAAGLGTEASPAAAAHLKVVGLQGASADITATATTLLSTVLDFTTFGLAQGQWIYIGGTAANTGFVTAACNGWARISLTTAITAQVITLDIVPTGMTTDAGTSKTIQIFYGDYIRNGTTPQSANIEVEYTDLATPEYDVYIGTRWGFELSATEQNILEFVATMQGTNASNGTSRTAGASTAAAGTNSIMNTSSQISQMRVN